MIHALIYAGRQLQAHVRPLTANVNAPSDHGARVRPKNNTYPSTSLSSKPLRPSSSSFSGAEKATPRDANSAASASGSGAYREASHRAPGSHQQLGSGGRADHSNKTLR